MTTDAKRTTLRMRRAVCAVGPGLLLTLLMPKCPLCVAVLLSSVGLGGALATKLAPSLQLLPLAALALPLAIYAYTFIRARKRPQACGCNKPTATPTAAAHLELTSHPPLSQRTSRLDIQPARQQTSAS